MTAEFSASLLQSSVSHDPSEIILISTVQETFPIIINVENCIIVLHFFGNQDASFPRFNLFEIEIF